MKPRPPDDPAALLDGRVQRLRGQLILAQVQIMGREDSAAAGVAYFTSMPRV